ncbi:MAG: nucleotidyltransferase family protein [Pseudomonadota bacterium]
MTNKQSFNNPKPTLDAESRLLLMTAKPFFDREQVAEIDQLIPEIKDWERVSETAVRKFSAPYLLRALTECASDNVPRATMERLRAFTQFTKLRSLKIAATQIAFHEASVQPENMKYAYLKGTGFSVQFNGDYSERFCRDIDILVEENQFERIIRKASEIGYRVVLSVRPLKFAESRDDFKFVTKFFPDVGLLSPDGYLVEVHRRLSKRNHIFDVEDALKSTESFNLFGASLQTLRKPLHFTYICYHHSRHFWSHLHWLADLDLILRSKHFSREQAKKTADTIGLTPTIDASIRLHELISSLQHLGELNQDHGLASEFLIATLKNLKGGLDVEYELRKGAFKHDFISKDQISPDRVSDVTNQFEKSKFKPLRAHYKKRPIPAPLFWLYRIQARLIWLRERVTQRLPIGQKKRDQNAFNDTNQPMGREDKTD